MLRNQAVSKIKKKNETKERKKEKMDTGKIYIYLVELKTGKINIYLIELTKTIQENSIYSH